MRLLSQTKTQTESHRLRRPQSKTTGPNDAKHGQRTDIRGGMSARNHLQWQRWQMERYRKRNEFREVPTGISVPEGKRLARRAGHKPAPSGTVNVL